MWDLGPWPDERAWQRDFAARFDRPLASIVVATSKPQKDWLPERWAEVVDALWHDFGLQPVLVGGRSPREVARRAASSSSARRIAPHSALGSGLRNLVGILDASSLVLAPDTGPLHMAVALDRPVVSLMGYTNPKRTGPYRKFHDLIVDAYGDPGEDYPDQHGESTRSHAAHHRPRRARPRRTLARRLSVAGGHRTEVVARVRPRRADARVG